MSLKTRINPRGRSRRRRCLRTCLKSETEALEREGSRFGGHFEAETVPRSPFLEGPKLSCRPQSESKVLKNRLQKSWTSRPAAQARTGSGKSGEGAGEPKMRKPVRWDLKMWSPKPDYRVGISRAFSNPAPPSRFSNRFSSSACGAIIIGYIERPRHNYFSARRATTF